MGTPQSPEIIDQLRRRGFLKAVGAGAGLTTISGGVGGTGAREATETLSSSSAAQLSEHDADAIHPIFGFPAESLDVELPVEPDHEVFLRERARAQENVPFPEWYFEPTGLYVEPGDTVQFTLESPLHTVSAYHPDLGFAQRVPDGVGAITSPPLWGGAYFLYTFEEPGVYDLNCLPHQWAGMVVRVVVGEVSGPGAEPVPEPDLEFQDPAIDPEPAQPSEVDALVFRDPAMDPENILDVGSVSWDDLDPESKAFPMELLEPEMPPSEEPDGAPLVATLTGDEQGVDTAAKGCASFRPDGDDALVFHLLLQDIRCVTQAHIHEGARGVDGPVVAPMVAFTEEIDGTGDGEARSGTLEDPIVAVGTIDDADVVAAVLENPTGYYVNVHTTEHPAGEIRGQITTGQPDDPMMGEGEMDGDGEGEVDDDGEEMDDDGEEEMDDDGEETDDDGEGEMDDDGEDDGDSENGDDEVDSDEADDDSGEDDSDDGDDPDSDDDGDDGDDY